MDYFEFYSWSQQWFMDNFPPLPLVKFESPCYDPFEIDPSHYPDDELDYYFNDRYFNDNYNDRYFNYNFNNNNTYYNDRSQHYEESESSESDLEEEDHHDFN